MKNRDIRYQIRKNRLYQYEIARKIGISEFTLCRWLRNDMTDVQKEKIISAIKSLTKINN